MDDQKIMEFMSRIFEELKELKEGQLQNRESIEIVAVQTELLTTNFERLETGLDGLETRFDGLETRFDRLEAEVRDIKDIVLRIENDHGTKIKALFDGHQQNKEKIVEYGKVLRREGLL